MPNHTPRTGRQRLRPAPPRHRRARAVRPILILGILCAAGAVALAVPRSAGAAFQARDTAGVPDTVAVDSTPDLHAGPLATKLDSLRIRSQQFRAAITRLRIRYDVRVQRVESGLRFELPYPPSVPNREDGEEAVGPVRRIANLARRYYPSPSVSVLGTLDGTRPACGTGPERRRAREVVQRLRQHGGLDTGRIRRAECVRSTVTDADTPTGARELRLPGATIYIEWDSPDDSS